VSAYEERDENAVRELISQMQQQPDYGIISLTAHDEIHPPETVRLPNGVQGGGGYQDRGQRTDQDNNYQGGDFTVGVAESQHKAPGITGVTAVEQPPVSLG